MHEGIGVVGWTAIDGHVEAFKLGWRSTGTLKLGFVRQNVGRLGSKLEQQSTGHGSIQAWTVIDGHVEAVLRQTNAKSLSNQKRCKFTCACAHMCNTPGFANGFGHTTPPDACPQESQTDWQAESEHPQIGNWKDVSNTSRLGNWKGCGEHPGPGQGNLRSRAMNDKVNDAWSVVKERGERCVSPRWMWIPAVRTWVRAKASGGCGQPRLFGKSRTSCAAPRGKEGEEGGRQSDGAMERRKGRRCRRNSENRWSRKMRIDGTAIEWKGSGRQLTSGRQHRRG